VRRQSEPKKKTPVLLVELDPINVKKMLPMTMNVNEAGEWGRRLDEAGE
jgi:hypothetical protein